MIPSWYDVLGVEETATSDEIRAAWQESIVGLDPTDRRFKQRNRAAEVLLDPDRRAAHDADLAAQEVDEDAAEPDVPARSDDEPDDDPVTLAKTDDADEAVDVAAPRRRPGPRTAVVLAVVATLLLVATVLSLVLGGPGQRRLPDEREVAAARKAAETAVGPVLSYDYRDLDASRAAATSFMTPAYAEEYERNFDGYIAPNAPNRKAIVTAEVVASAIVRTGRDRVDVLVFVNRPTRNADRDEVSRDQVTLRMVDVDGQWLVSCLTTSSSGPCET
jgi:Mce-associated membrane protein